MSMLQLRYSVPGDDFTRAGEASGDVKHKLKKLGYNPSAIRRVSIAMYEGEINMVIHAGGGEANVDVDPDKVVIVLTDHGPGIADVEKAMQEGWSTAPDNVRSLGFGAGMGGMTETCGAISGAVAIMGFVMSDGMENPKTKGQTYKLSREIAKRFGEKNTTTVCGTLKGIGSDKGPLRSCPGCIDDAVEIACDMLKQLAE